MKAFIYAADLYCEDCGEELKRELPVPPGADLDNESTYDSDQYPKGPYSNGGGEADRPQNCASCRTFLENPLTPDGSTYMDQCAAEAAHYFEAKTGKVAGEYGWDDVAAFCEAHSRPTLAEWITYYLAWGR